MRGTGGTVGKLEPVMGFPWMIVLAPAVCKRGEMLGSLAMFEKGVLKGARFGTEPDLPSGNGLSAPDFPNGEWCSTVFRCILSESRSFINCSFSRWNFSAT